MARPRVSEVRAVAALLQEPAENAEELAARIIQAIDTDRLGRRQYVLGLQGQGGHVEIWGPFSTAKQAEKYVPTATSGWGVALVSPYPLLQPVPSTTPRDARFCPECKHSVDAHSWHLVKGARKILSKYKVRGCISCDCDWEDAA